MDHSAYLEELATEHDHVRSPKELIPQEQSDQAYPDFKAGPGENYRGVIQACFDYLKKCLLEKYGWSEKKIQPTCSSI